MAGILLAGMSYGQRRHDDTKGKTGIELSLDTVTRRLDNMHVILNQVSDSTGRSYDTRKIEAQLPDIRYNLKIIADNLSLQTAVPETRDLQLYGVLLKDIQQQLENARNALFKYNNDLISLNAGIAAFTKDSVIHQLVKDSMYRKMYLDIVAELYRKWKLAERTTRRDMDRIDSVQSEVSAIYFQAVELQSRVDGLKKVSGRRLFSKDNGFLWEGRDTAASVDRAMRQALNSYRGQKGIIRYYISQNWDNYIYILLIGLLFFFWVRYNYRRKKNPLELRYLKQATPYLSTVVIMLNIIPFFDVDAPAVYTQIVQLVMMIALSILFLRRWPRRYLLQWFVVVVLYMFFSATGVVLVPFIGVRFWLLLLNILSLTLGARAIRKILHFLPYSLPMKAVAIIFRILNILAVLANVFGRLSLANIFGVSAIFGMVQAIGLYVFIKIVHESLELQVAVSREAEKPGREVFVYGKLEGGMSRALSFFSVCSWIVVFTINMDLYDPLYARLSVLLTTAHKVGTISFRLGNILVFCLVIYLSNVLQKYIGYLFGPEDEHAVPAAGRKGSRLVMIRLILIISGFLLAVVASGLPLDKITIVLGALGVGIGLGLQNIVNNLVSGVILIFERPFQIGDFIELNGKKGIVRNMGIRSSRLVTEEGTEIIMPNADLLSGEVINWTVRNNQVRVEMPVNIEAGHSFEEINGIIVEALKGHHGLSKESPPKVLLATATEKTLSVVIHAWVVDIASIQTIKSEMLTVVYRALKEKGIKTQ